ncbi:MAG: EAL domain-containing protein [Cyanobacteria bacterium P01_C01_bin.70]
MHASLSDNELSRIAKLHEYRILDTLPEENYDEIADLAAYICETPVALISLIDTNRQWFKAKVGLKTCGTPRDVAFCAHALTQKEILLVSDAQTDARFAQNPLVTGEPYIRFYAGAPLITPDDYALGTLCVIDYQPRTLSAKQINALQVLSRQVITQLELRANLTKLQTEIKERQQAEASQLHLSSLNKQLESLVQARTEALQAAKQELEHRVEKRTAELFNSLQQLRTTQEKLRARESQLIHDAMHDSLTGLPNRTHFLKRLEQVMQASRQTPQACYAVLFIDLDSFKAINDSLGHEIGDRVLQHLANRLKTFIDADDFLARLGGDEFAVLLNGIHSAAKAKTVSRQLQSQLNRPLEVGQHEFVVSASIGLAFNVDNHGRPEQILREADIAMYQAKRSGKRCCVIFNTQMQQQAAQRLQLESDLHQALQRQEFCLQYQPILDLKTQELAGLEALIRWQHPQQGLLNPGHFIQVAEEIGLIHAIGCWVIRAVCGQMQHWQTDFPDFFTTRNLVMHVNVSPLQLRYGDFIRQIEKVLAVTEIAPENLKLEITESCIVEDFFKTTDALKKLKQLGFQLCIDDFGTGYSALSRLHQMPIDTLKIDRAFISNLETDVSIKKIVKTILVLAHGLHMNVVAEGIETPSQMKTLQSLGCEYGQGFLWSKPIDAHAITAYFR